MQPILLVEDSALFGKLVLKRISKVVDRQVVWAKSLAEAQAALQDTQEGFEFAILDLHLPDATQDDVVQLVVECGISSFVFTADSTAELREMVWAQGVADYIVKDDPRSLDYLQASMAQLLTNRNILVLIVSGSPESRTYLSELLYVRKYRVINASSGEIALNILAQHPETRLVLCDAHLNDMEGSQLCRKIRELYGHDNLALLGMVEASEPQCEALFLENGANEAIHVNPLIVEEFYAKVRFCLENLDGEWPVSDQDAENGSNAQEN